MATLNQSTAAKRKLLDKFVKKARLVPEVKKILSLDGSEKILTVLDDKPFEDEPRNRIYEIEAEILRESDAPLLDFHLINLSEFDEDQRPYLLSEQAKVLYERH